MYIYVFSCIIISIIQNLPDFLAFYMINVKISYTCLVESHHWNHHLISSSTDYDTRLTNLYNDIMSYMTDLLRNNYSSLGRKLCRRLCTGSL